MQNQQNQHVDLVPSIQGWLLQDGGAISAQYWLGGWERWAQGQITIFTNRQQNAPKVGPELNPYLNNRQRVDLEAKQAGHTPALIELKCCTSRDNAKEFSDRVFKDSNKLASDLLKVQYQAHKLYVVAIIPISQARDAENHLHDKGTPVWKQANAGDFDVFSALLNP